MAIDVQTVDLSALSDEDLRTLQSRVGAEVEKRLAPARIDAVVQASLEREGVHPRDEWRQPTSAVDAYPRGWVVLHGGVFWESLTAANVWEPGVSGWRQVSEDELGTAPWVRPSGASDAYMTGDRVSFEGKDWVSKIDANVWSPAEYPAGWSLVVDDPGEPPVEAPTADAWVQPTGASDAYAKGAQVEYGGLVYESLVDGNTWSPIDYPAGWKQVV